MLFLFIKDHHSNMVEYHVPVAPGGVASIFNQLESNKAALQIQHFSVSQTTLDEVRHIITAARLTEKQNILLNLSSFTPTIQVFENVLHAKYKLCNYDRIVKLEGRGNKERSGDVETCSNHLSLPSQVFINFAEGKMVADSKEVTDGSDVDSLDSYNALDT